MNNKPKRLAAVRCSALVRPLRLMLAARCILRYLIMPIQLVLDPRFIPLVRRILALQLRYCVLQLQIARFKCRHAVFQCEKRCLYLLWCFHIWCRNYGDATSRPNDPSSATAATRRADCNCDAPPPFAAAHG